VLPQIEPTSLRTLDALIAAERAADVDADPVRRLASLLPRDPNLAEDVAARLRLSNKAKKRLACAAGEVGDLPPPALAYRVGTECAVDRLLLAGRTADATVIRHWHAPRLPITGGALIKRGLPEGPVVARTLRAIDDRWVEAGFPSGEAFERIVAEALSVAR
jgi:poly(A) polymerase